MVLRLIWQLVDLDVNRVARVIFGPCRVNRRILIKACPFVRAANVDPLSQVARDGRERALDIDSSPAFAAKIGSVRPHIEQHTIPTEPRQNVKPGGDVLVENGVLNLGEIAGKDDASLPEWHRLADANKGGLTLDGAKTLAAAVIRE